MRRACPRSSSLCDHRVARLRPTLPAKTSVARLGCRAAARMARWMTGRFEHRPGRRVPRSRACRRQYHPPPPRVSASLRGWAPLPASSRDLVARSAPGRGTIRESPPASPALLGTGAAEEVIAKNIEARGGLARIKAIETVRYTARVPLRRQPASVFEETGASRNMTVMILELKRPNWQRALAGQGSIAPLDEKWHAHERPVTPP